MCIFGVTLTAGLVPVGSRGSPVEELYDRKIAEALRLDWEALRKRRDEAQLRPMQEE